MKIEVLRGILIPFLGTGLGAAGVTLMMALDVALG
jgi:hypothetical protein